MNSVYKLATENDFFLFISHILTIICFHGLQVFERQRAQDPPVRNIFRSLFLGFFVSKQRISWLIEIRMTLLIGSKDLSWYWRSNEQERIHYPQDVAICFFFCYFEVPSRIPRLITLTETLTKPDITKTVSNNCFIEHCFKENSVLIVACTDHS